MSYTKKNQFLPNPNPILNVKKHSMNKKSCEFHDNFSTGVVILSNNTDRSDWNFIKPNPNSNLSPLKTIQRWQIQQHLNRDY